MQRNQHRTAKEQGNDGEQDSGANLASPVWIRGKAEIGEASHVVGSQKRPEQEHSRDQDSAMKERVEIVFRQKREHALRCKRLS